MLSAIFIVQVFLIYDAILKINSPDVYFPCFFFIWPKWFGLMLNRLSCLPLYRLEGKKIIGFSLKSVASWC